MNSASNIATFPGRSESGRVAAARRALEAVQAELASVQARGEQTQQAYYIAVNTVTRLEPEARRLQQALRVAQDKSYVDSLISTPSQLDRIAREKAADEARIAPLFKSTCDELTAAYAARSSHGARMKACEVEVRSAQLRLEGARFEYDTARLAELLGPHAELIEGVLARTDAEQLRALLREAIARPAPLPPAAAA